MVRRTRGVTMQSDRESGWFRRISLMQGPLKAIHVAALVAFALLIALYAVPRAKQPPAPAAPPPAVPAPAKPLVPVATNTVTAHPDAYYGQAVTINAAVEQILSKSAFSVDQRRVGAAADVKHD